MLVEYDNAMPSVALGDIAGGNAVPSLYSAKYIFWRAFFGSVKAVRASV